MVPKRELNLSDNESTRSRTPSPVRPSKKSKKAATTPSPSTPTKSAQSKFKAKSESGSPGKKIGAWGKDELVTLYGIMNPKKTGVKWDEVAAQVPGRDVKACMNKWSRMQAKIMEAIGAMGE